ncbi:amino acid permease [Grosmannia clavigera kw1407]|uniref:Amino acid permease n=1 Tax=Grosmannia clavigera (strain kw1407 / UAMH 11150) TaxID=655863 RepID=F0XKP5_GROCL|nr:amino acid permease [Grosmannia clavigera kw1407]EFX01760.1 amino acid permease [Grosmannia clavigera kw1407]
MSFSLDEFDCFSLSMASGSTLDTDFGVVVVDSDGDGAALQRPFDVWSYLGLQYSLNSTPLDGMVVYISVGALLIITVLLARTHPKQSVSFIFTDYVNQTGWKSEAWFYSGSPARLMEPKENVLRVMMGSAFLSTIAGFPMIFVLMFCIKTPDNLLAPIGGQPVSQLLLESLDFEALAIIGHLIYTVCMFAATICTLPAPSLVLCQRHLCVLFIVVALGSIQMGSTAAISAILGGGIVLLYVVYEIVLRASKKAQQMMNEPSPGQASHSGETNAQPNAAEQQSASPSSLSPPQRTGDITTQVRLLGRQESNFPHIFRDGGGGGTVSGQDLIIFADGMYTRGPPPTDPSRMVNFISNSIAVLGPSGAATTTIRRVTDTGSEAKGPDQALPFLEDQGETPSSHAIWPNENIATIQGGTIGVTFSEVIDRRLFRQQKQALLYNTPIEIHVQQPHAAGDAAVVSVSRPHKSLFLVGEPMFGSFVTYATDDYLYLFGRVSETDNPRSNGLKLARVRPADWANRQLYEYWNGQAFGPEMPARDDNGAANVLCYTQEIFGKHYGPGAGDIFWSDVYKEYILLFQSAGAALDDNCNHALTGGWSAPESIFKIPRASDGFSYAFHAYPNMSPDGKVVPITWTQDSKSQSCSIYTGEIVFT